jgi:hypothetical protein
LPKSLEAHHKLCTPEKPMLKTEKGKTYTGQVELLPISYKRLQNAVFVLIRIISCFLLLNRSKTH